jgi:hypothetical protein
MEQITLFYLTSHIHFSALNAKILDPARLTTLKLTAILFLDAIHS